MRGTGQAGQYQMQAVRVATARYLALGQLQLMETSGHLFLGQAIVSHILQHLQNHGFNLVCLLRVRALNTTGKAQFFLGVLKPAHGRGGSTQVGGFQSLLQWRPTVVQQYAGKQTRLHSSFQISGVSQQPGQHYMGTVVA